MIIYIYIYIYSISRQWGIVIWILDTHKKGDDENMKTKKSLLLMCLLLVLMIASVSETWAASYPSSNVTLQDEGGNYSLAYILKNYNHFILNDASAGHTIGPVAIGGKANYRAGNGNANYSHRVSSFIKGEIETILPDGYFKNLYLGEVNMTNSFSGQNRPTYYNNNYLDFDLAFNSISNEIQGYQGENNLSQEIINQVKLTSWNQDEYIGNGWKLTNDGNNVNPKLRLVVKAGQSFNFASGVISELTRIDIMYDGEVNARKDTLFISNDGGSITLPYVYINGDANTIINMGVNHEWGDGFSITTILPNAIDVKDKDANQVHVGHVVAPKAFVHNMNGDINGCIIASSLDVANGESHMWPYMGTMLTDEEFIVDEIESTSISLKVEKLLDDKVTNNQFEFKAKLIQQPHGSFIQYESIVKNNGKDIIFKQLDNIDYSGEYIFEVSELIGNRSDIEYDSNKYFIKVKVIKEDNYKVDKISYYQDSNEITKIVFRNKTINKVEETENNSDKIDISTNNFTANKSKKHSSKAVLTGDKAPLFKYLTLSLSALFGIFLLKKRKTIG